ncbi:MAG: hypothetical protein JST92_16085 [Deltaproteobacteria bacterium]|nr:hypothetical protein [Deltaproteobacteria bacterium]
MRIPFEFVLDELAAVEPRTRRIFMATGVYVGEKIVFILNESEKYKQDHGVWIATGKEHHESLRKALPSMKNIDLLGKDTHWQNLPSSGPDFEREVARACALVVAGDPRIGRVPQRVKARKKRAARGRPQR